MKTIELSAKANKFGRILFYVFEDKKHLYEFNNAEDAAAWVIELGRRALINSKFF